VEFILGLQTHELELMRQQVELDLAACKAGWLAKRDELQSAAASVSAHVEGVPIVPTIATDDVVRASLFVDANEGRASVEDVASSIRDRIAHLVLAEASNVEEVANETTAELERMLTLAAEHNTRRSNLFRARQAEVAQLLATDRRIAALEEDLQKNLDAQKLRNLGSTLAEAFTADHCPTCAQPIHDTLLAQKASAEVMPIADNIEYIKSQRGIFLRLRARAQSTITALERQLAAATAEVNEASARVRALRSDLLAPSHVPSITELEERLRLESRLHILEDAQQRFEEQKLALISLSARYAELLARRTELGGDRLSTDDRLKLSRRTSLVREQAESYGFSTFPAKEIDISPDTYRPQKEGFEIGFELSASDAIRLKWAYQLALMEVTRTAQTNHPGLVVFDEPRQQETAKMSFRSLLVRAAATKGADQQVIFATSEDRQELNAVLSAIDCHLVAFEGHVVQRIQNRPTS
jgi:hypothetical protein